MQGIEGNLRLGRALTHARNCLAESAERLRIVAAGANVVHRYSTELVDGNICRAHRNTCACREMWLLFESAEMSDKVDHLSRLEQSTAAGMHIAQAPGLPA